MSPKPKAPTIYKSGGELKPITLGDPQARAIHPYSPADVPAPQFDYATMQTPAGIDQALLQTAQALRESKKQTLGDMQSLYGGASLPQSGADNLVAALMGLAPIAIGAALHGGKGAAIGARAGLAAASPLLTRSANNQERALASKEAELSAIDKQIADTEASRQKFAMDQVNQQQALDTQSKLFAHQDELQSKRDAAADRREAEREDRFQRGLDAADARLEKSLANKKEMQDERHKFVSGKGGRILGPDYITDAPDQQIPEAKATEIREQGNTLKTISQLAPKVKDIYQRAGAFESMLSGNAKEQYQAGQDLQKVKMLMNIVRQGIISGNGAFKGNLSNQEQEIISRMNLDEVYTDKDLFKSLMQFPAASIGKLDAIVSQLQQDRKNTLDTWHLKYLPDDDGSLVSGGASDVQDIGGIKVRIRKGQ